MANNLCSCSNKPGSTSQCKCRPANQQFGEIISHLRRNINFLRQDLMEQGNFETRSPLSLLKTEPNEKQQAQCSQLVQTEESKKSRIEKFMSKQCPICLEYLCVLGWQSLLVWPCGHLYCEKCSNRLVSHEPMLATCSVCRNIVETDGIRRIF